MNLFNKFRSLLMMKIKLKWVVEIKEGNIRSKKILEEENNEVILWKLFT